MERRRQQQRDEEECVKQHQWQQQQQQQPQQQQQRRRRRLQQEQQQEQKQRPQTQEDESKFPRTRRGSNIVQVNDVVREGQITTILPISTFNDAGENILADFFVFVEVAAFLAIDQFNRRSGEILPHLPERLRDCDLYLKVDHQDTFFSPIDGARAFLGENCGFQQKPRQRRRSRQGLEQGLEKKYQHDEEEDEKQQQQKQQQQQQEYKQQQEEEYHDILFSNSSKSSSYNDTERDFEAEECRGPFAVVGAGRSAVSQSLSILGEPLEMPLISPTSTSAELDQYAFFSRTVPTNAGDAKAVAMYLQHLNVSHVGILYVRDSYGIGFQVDLIHELRARGINSKSVSYHDLHSGEIENSISQLLQVELRYFVGIFAPGTWRPIIQQAAVSRIMGIPDCTWIFTEGSKELISPSLNFDRESEQQIAKALHGSAIIMIDIPRSELFVRAMTDFANNQSAQEELFSFHKKQYDGQLLPEPALSSSQYFGFDAALALGIAACETPGLFTGREFMQTLLQTEFEGVSGLVSLNNQTGTRSSENMAYGVFNLLLSEERSNPSQFYFTAEKTADIDFSNNSIVHVQPFQYPDGGTIPPLPLPPLKQNLNLIPHHARAIGYGLGTLVIALSIFWISWIWYYHKDYVVNASQPIFLTQLCVGTFIMGVTIFPLGFQEPMSVQFLDKTCMSIPWLLAIGFVTAFSALFSKTWRLNRLFNSGEAFRRVAVRVQDVVKPFFILMAINCSLLSLWTLLFPVRWVRVPIPSYDKYGRIVASYGTCRPYGDNTLFGNKLSLLCSLPLFLVNMAGVCVAAYQGYKARNLSADLSEARYLVFCMFSLVETFVMAGPLLFLFVDNPVTNFLIRSIFITIVCLTILLPVFLPKYVQRKIRKREGLRSMGSSRNQRALAIRSLVSSRNVSRSSMGLFSLSHSRDDLGGALVSSRNFSRSFAESRTFGGDDHSSSSRSRRRGGSYHLVDQSTPLSINGSGSFRLPRNSSTCTVEVVDGNYNRPGMTRVRRSRKYFEQIERELTSGRKLTRFYVISNEPQCIHESFIEFFNKWNPIRRSSHIARLEPLAESSHASHSCSEAVPR